MLQRQDLATHPIVKRVLEAPELFGLMEELMQVASYEKLLNCTLIALCTAPVIQASMSNLHL